MTRLFCPRPHARGPALAPVAALVLAMLSAPAARAQGGARIWGMAGAGTTTARGLDAVAWNPANLALGHPSLSLGLPSLSADLHNNAFSLARYNAVSGATLGADDKASLLRDIPAGGFALRAEVHADAAGIGLGNAALTVSGIAGGSGRIAKDVFDLVLLGNPVDRAFVFDGTGGEGYALGAATLSVGVPLATGYRGRLSAGVNLRWLRGFYELHFEEATGGLVTTMGGLAGQARTSYLTSSGGQGYAADFGLALQAPRGWTFGLAIDNAYSGVNWTRRPERRVWSVTADSLDATRENLDAQVVRDDTTYAVSSYRTTLPRRLRVGASNTFGALLVAVDVAKELSARVGPAEPTEVRAGVEWHPCALLQPRLGAALGGDAGRSSAAGLGLRLGPWRLDLAAVNRGRLWPRDTKGLGVSAGTRLEF